MDKELVLSQNPLVPPSIAAQIKAKVEGHRKRVMHGKTLCSRCLINPPQATHKYCKPCKSAYGKAKYAAKKATKAAP